MADLPKIWLSSPHMSEREEEYVQEAFRTNWIAPLGPHVNGFEQDLQTYNDVAHAAALTSGTAAMHLALDMLDVGPGDYVICQSFTFCGSTNPIAYLGATPILIDSEADTWNMCPQALERALEDYCAPTSPTQGKVKAIIPVHLYGNPAKMQEILALGQKYGLPVLEDAAESLGSTYQGQKTGSMGLMSIYSFNGNKIITTSGGGALVSQDQKYTDRARFLATQARDQAPHYEHSTIGYNYRLSNVLAGIGRGQMEVLDHRIEQRRANFQRYRKFFQSQRERADFQIEFQEEEPQSWSNRWLTSILVDPSRNKGLHREEIREELASQNIEARPLWKPMHLQPVFQGAPYYTKAGLCPDSSPQNSLCDLLFEQGLCLPSGSNLSPDDWTRIERSLENIFAQRRG